MSPNPKSTVACESSDLTSNDFTFVEAGGKDRRHEIEVKMKKFLTLSLYFALFLLVLIIGQHSQAEKTQTPESSKQNPEPIAQQTTQDIPVALSEHIKNQLYALMLEKESRTPNQQKIDSQLIMAVKMKFHQEVAPGIVTMETDVAYDSDGRAEVDISGEVTDELLATIRGAGGEVVNSYPQFEAVRAYLTLESLEKIAGLSEVRVISRAAKAELSGTNHVVASQARTPFDKRAQHVREQLLAALPQGGSVLPVSSSPVSTSDVSPSAVSTSTVTSKSAKSTGVVSAPAVSTSAVSPSAVTSSSTLSSIAPQVPFTGSVTSEGDVTHTANQARASFSATGAGIKIGVISDSVDFLAQSQASGNLPSVTVLSGRSGVPATGEGTAMLEIIYDLAPGAQLFFSTANGGPAAFAQNILDLRAAGCNIIVDDAEYPNESPFQDAVIAQAVNTVTAAGTLYFSSAGNSGNVNDLTSSVWEGDFVDGGPVTSNGTPIGNAHRFFTPNIILNKAFTNNPAGEKAYLFWSDPLTGSANDYDLYIVSSSGTIVRSSTNTQNGTQDPVENVSIANGEQVLVVKKTGGATRYLHVNVGRGSFTYQTAGRTKGHSATVNAFSVAAVKARTSFPSPFTGGAINPVETFSSDGPRRVFYAANGTAITPGNVSSTGGTVRAKPDIAAADGVSTSVPGFGTFFGTSAAAPHAAAIAGLLLSFNPSLTPAQVRTALTSTALDIEATGSDRDSGAGIVMAQAALQSVANCTYSLNPTSQNFAAGGGSGSFSVTTSASCAWTAVSNVSWVTTSSSGSGNGTVNFAVAANTGAARTGTITVGALGFTVSQAAGGGGGCPSTPITFGQTINGTLATSDCAFSGTTRYVDVYNFSGTSGQQIAVTMNSSAFDTYLFLLDSGNQTIAQDDDGGGGTNGTNSRIPATSGFFTLPATGAYTIYATAYSADGTTGSTGAYSISLLGGSNCVYALNPTSDIFIATAGTGSFTVSTAANCTWTAVSNVSWITTSSSGTGNGTVNYSVATNTGNTRTGTISVGGSTFSVFQSAGNGNGCPVTPIVPGQTINATLTTGCMFTGTSRYVDPYSFTGTAGQQIVIGMSSTTFDTYLFLVNPALTVAQDDDGGGGTNSRIPANAGFFTLPSSATYTIYATSFSSTGTTGSTGAYSISLLSSTSCSYSINPASQSVAAAGGSSSFGISAPAGCTWTALSNAGWITTSSSGSGNGTINYSVAANTGPARSGTISAGGQLFTVNQSGSSFKSKKTGVFRPSTGELFLKNANSSGFADTYIIFGNPGDYPVAGDWNGDGIDSVGIYRNGVFYLRNTNSTGFADIVVPFGNPSDQPVVGDWNGDGVDTIGVYRSGTFILRNSNTAGSPDLVFTLGNPGDVGIAGDWNGDGVTTCGVFRPSNGIVYLKNSNTTGFADLSFVFGNAGDKPVAGDWNGDGIDTVGIYRNGLFYLTNSNTTGFADIVFALGNSGDFPIAGNWNGAP
jgi:hypothetical protein